SARHTDCCGGHPEGSMEAVSLVCHDALTLRGGRNRLVAKVRRRAPVWLLGLGLLAACTDDPMTSEPETCFPLAPGARVIAVPPGVGTWNPQGTTLQGYEPTDTHGQGTELQGQPPNIMQFQGTDLQGQ